ncbi:MAG TPA: hypothetical protein VFP84_09230 [Kofleriaceae bacterium]|nr:hypothetical protein [Kofleriaceae bacterium]
MAIGCGKVDATVDAGPTRTVACDATTHTVQVLQNGNFDLTAPAWSQVPAAPPSFLCGQPRITPFDGEMSACLGGTDGQTSTLTQTIALPAGATSLTLDGEICIDTAETNPVDSDTLVFDIAVGDASIATLGMRSNQQGAHPCQFQKFTLQAPLTGATVPATATLRLRSNLDTNNATSFYIDALSLTAACAP